MPYAGGAQNLMKRSGLWSFSKSFSKRLFSLVFADIFRYNISNCSEHAKQRFCEWGSEQLLT